MKHPTKIFLFFILICLSANSCKKDDDNDWSPPPSGDYFTCLIDGQRFETQSSFNCRDELFSYYSAGVAGFDESYLLAYGRNCESGSTVAIRMSDINPGTGYYDLTDTIIADSSFPVYRIGYHTHYETLESGFIQIDEFSLRESPNGDFGNFQGSFGFVLRNDSLQTSVNITEGQFRFEVPNTSW